MVSGNSTYQVKIDSVLNEDSLRKGLYIAVVHATRIPPHIGMVADKHYHSLSVKGQDIDTPLTVLLKNSSIRNIPTLFIKIKAHPVFSDVYLREHFITNVKQFKRVDVGVATCLSPLKLFFEEVYNAPVQAVNYLYELLPVLEAEGLIESVFSMNVDLNSYKLPVYTNKEINAGIEQVRKEFNPQS